MHTVRKFSCILSLITIIGCGTDGSEGKSSRTRIAISDTYITHCSTCHGEMGEGGIGKALNNEHIKDMSDAQLFMMIYNGIGTSMPAFNDSLSTEEITEMINYIRDF